MPVTMFFLRLFIGMVGIRELKNLILRFTRWWTAIYAVWSYEDFERFCQLRWSNSCRYIFKALVKRGGCRVFFMLFSKNILSHRNFQFISKNKKNISSKKLSVVSTSSLAEVWNSKEESYDCLDNHLANINLCE